MLHYIHKFIFDIFRFDMILSSHLAKLMTIIIILCIRIKKILVNNKNSRARYFSCVLINRLIN